jgi:hypothetical protein
MSGREPDTGEDPRRQGTGEGLPESEEQGKTPTEGTDQGPEADTGKQPSSPSGADQDDSPSGATGNPDAAGG